mmetsp:Transcript_66731/g.139311  ORF Transcript_66731/g.139311 Transcript_66731/m.139311 type:complete len:84 (+) Transcript_66731:749-1000(+)
MAVTRKQNRQTPDHRQEERSFMGLTASVAAPAPMKEEEEEADSRAVSLSLSRNLQREGAKDELRTPMANKETVPRSMTLTHHV